MCTTSQTAAEVERRADSSGSGTSPCALSPSVDDGCYELDPLVDRRWAELVARHPHSSVYHSLPWLESLKRTYGYRPVAYTTTPPGAELKNGVVFCRVQSWLTSPRLVSLPFSDHCRLLVNDSHDLYGLLACLAQKVEQEELKYIELRPWSENTDYPSGFGEDCEHWHHTLDLSPDLNELFRNFQKSSIQRKIRRAKREGLVYEEGRSRLLLESFYRLMLITRRRHRLPPPPFSWFKNLADCLGEKLKIRVASKDGRAVAALLTLSFKNTVVYKYGGSDAGFHNLGGVPLLLWKTIEDARREGAQELDLGRTDRENTGLITFKERFGATRSESTYLRFPASSHHTRNGAWKMRMAKCFFSKMPDSTLVAAGRLIYPHIG